MATEKLKYNQLVHFLEVDIWKMRLSTLPRFKSFIYRILRIIILATRGFIKNECSLKASALTFFSALSIVPVVALAFGLSKGFGLDEFLRQQILDSFSGQEELLREYIFDWANRLLNSAKGGLIAGIGLVVLLYTVMRLLHNIEDTFNQIYEVKKSRTWVRKFADYFAIMLIAPVMVIIASSLTVYINAQVINLADEIELLGKVKPFILFGLRLIPYLLIWVVFTLLYMIMPNTKVDYRSAIVAGIFAGTMYQLLQWGYINFQVGVSRYNAIYGSFAALPLFLIWMQFSWIIVLIGAELAFSHQNVDRYEFDSDGLQMSPKHKKLVALLIVKIVIERFQKGEEPYTIDDLSREIELPIRFVQQIVRELQEAKVISELNGDREPAYQPAVDIQQITVHYVVDKMENRGLNNVCVASSEEWDSINTTLEEIEQDLSNSAANKLIKDL